MEFQPLDAAIFRTRWRSWKTNCIMNEPLPFDRHILMITDDLIRYFPFIVDLTANYQQKSNWDSAFKSIYDSPNRQKNGKFVRNGKKDRGSDKKWGGAFIINHTREFLVKIRILEDFYIYFEVCERNGDERLARRVVETLCFIFCKVE